MTSQPDTAAISRSLSFYIAKDIPTGEIDQVIHWLTEMAKDIDYKISRLERLKAERERTTKWRQNLDSVARQFLDPENIHLDLETRQAIIQQRLGCDWHIAKAIAERVNAWSKRQIKKNRDQAICMRVDAGEKITDLAREFKMSRQQIHNILKKRPDHRFVPVSRINRSLLDL